MNFPCRQFVGAGVLILMTLASAPPRGFVHAHGECPAWKQQSQREAGRPEILQFHRHGAGPWHSHHGDGQVRAARAQHAQSHAHVFWLGWELVLTWPLERQQDGDLPIDFEDSQMVSRPRMDGCVTGRGPCEPLQGRLLPEDLPIQFAFSPADAASSGGEIRSSPPLCDSARRACCGVLLC